MVGSEELVVRFWRWKLRSPHVTSEIGFDTHLSWYAEKLHPSGGGRRYETPSTGNFEGCIITYFMILFCIPVRRCKHILLHCYLFIEKRIYYIRRQLESCYVVCIMFQHSITTETSLCMLPRRLHLHYRWLWSASCYNGFCWKVSCRIKWVIIMYKRQWHIWVLKYSSYLVSCLQQETQITYNQIIKEEHC